MKILILSICLILYLSQNTFAESSSEVSLDDYIIPIPRQYNNLRASKRIKENFRCMKTFLIKKVMKGKSKLKDKSKDHSVKDFFKTLKQSGYKFDIKVDRYDPKENLVSYEEPNKVRRIETKLKRYAKENGIEGKDVLDKLYYRLTDDDEMNDYYMKLVNKGIVSYDEIEIFYNDRKVRIINKRKRRRKQKDSVTAKLDKNKKLDIKIPYI